MKRREFLALVGGATLAPLVARAQQPMPLVGFLNGGVSSTGVDSMAAFRKGLSEAGLVEGRNVAVEYHWFGGEYDRVPAVIADLIRRRVAVIATPGFPPGALAVKAATSTIPLVFGVGDDPVKLGLVASLARPDGNVTGINFFVHELVTKRLGLMRELVPKAVRIAVVVNPGNAAAAEATIREARAGRHPDELWDKRPRYVSPGRHLCRQHCERRKTCRPSRAAIDQIRVRHQFANRACARHQRAADPARARRRGEIE